MTIIVDTREQRPFHFAHTKYQYTKTITASLVTGDYSLLGLEHVLAVERKSLDDLIQCLGKERNRFEKELARSRALQSFMVVIESTWHDVINGRYKSRMTPESAANSILAMQARWRCPFFFAGDRKQAEAATFNFLRHYLENAHRNLKNILKNHMAERETA